MTEQKRNIFCKTYHGKAFLKRVTSVHKHLFLSTVTFFEMMNDMDIGERRLTFPVIITETIDFLNASVSLFTSLLCN